MKYAKSNESFLPLCLRNKPGIFDPPTSSAQKWRHRML